MTQTPPSDPKNTRATVSHYDDPVYYDHTYKRRRADVDFYTALACQYDGPVLELGVGTGRVAISLAKAGVLTTGIDSSVPMLNHAKSRIAKLSKKRQERIELLPGDIRNLRLKRKFPLVISPFNVWMHLYTREDVEAACKTVKAHLRPDGVFAFDVLNPWPADLARHPQKIYKGRRFKHPTNKRLHQYAEAFRYDVVKQVHHIYMFALPEGSPEEGWTMEVPHRQFFPEELKNLLHYNGLDVAERYGDFERNPFTGDSDSQVMICKLR